MCFLQNEETTLSKLISVHLGYLIAFVSFWVSGPVAEPIQSKPIITVVKAQGSSRNPLIFFRWPVAFSQMDQLTRSNVL